MEKKDLKRLSEISSNDRAFLSVYISSEKGYSGLKKRIENLKKLLSQDSDELKQFRENLKILDNYLEKNLKGLKNTCFFICWMLDLFEVYKLDLPVKDSVIVDSSPYIRPLAELHDEFENFAVVIADNTKAKIMLYSLGKEEDEGSIKGKIKNHVKVGGWSQQRYERRRDKEIHHYSNEIVNKLKELDSERAFDRVVLVGGKEIIKEIENKIPKVLQGKIVKDKNIDIGKGEKFIHSEIYRLFEVLEREAETDLWKKIKNNYLKGGLAEVGSENVLLSVQGGRVEKILVNRKADIKGIRCRECDSLFTNTVDHCPNCNSESVFEVDLVNEITELALKTGAEVEFAEDIKELEHFGNITALLRY